ncbi:hypothetical protein RRF57_010357 [Xylaria bambusicola]|uniref:C2H2-type domain-containing protein n=1 Tax=Xylaria bambusicola TaxID=326684 RepID=A0AAN7UUV7_9PEZI
MVLKPVAVTVTVTKKLPRQPQLANQPYYRPYKSTKPDQQNIPTTRPAPAYVLKQNQSVPSARSVCWSGKQQLAREQQLEKYGGTSASLTLPEPISTGATSSAANHQDPIMNCGTIPQDFGPPLQNNQELEHDVTHSGAVRGTTQKSKTCSICNKHYRSSNKLRDHICTKPDPQLFSLEESSKTFGRKGGLLQYVNTLAHKNPQMKTFEIGTGRSDLLSKLGQRFQEYHVTEVSPTESIKAHSPPSDD